MKLKYVKLKEYNSIIIFPEVIQHSEFSHMGVKSAGFCHIDNETKSVVCYGESYSLKLSSEPNDTLDATKQVFGIEAVLNLINP